jgi:phosphate transport system substrate-binding protein
MKNRLTFTKIRLFQVFLLSFGIAVILLCQGCKQKEKKQDDLSQFTSNTTIFAVDESFRPIVDEELYIFKALNPKAQPNIIYAPENTVINLLLTDSIRVLLTSRDFTSAEYQALRSKNIQPVVSRFAVDAVALIVNNASTDTTITVNEIKKMLNGNTKPDKNIVFDNPNSGLVRYLKEFSGNKDLKQKNIFALKSNKEVIQYVAGHPNAIGITGFGWLNDPDKDYAEALQNVKVVGVKDDAGKNSSAAYYTPSQTTLSLKQYPLTRNLYFINCTGKYGLGMEFATFLESDRGQRIILKSGLLPDIIPAREINIVRK